MNTLADLIRQLEEVQGEIDGYTRDGPVKPFYEEDYSRATAKVEELHRQIAASKAELAEEVADTRSTEVSPQEIIGEMTTADPVFVELVRDAEENRRRKNWDQARKSAQEARAFANSEIHVKTIRLLLERIDSEQLAAENAAIDAKTSELMEQARQLAGEGRFPAALERLDIANRIARPQSHPEINELRQRLVRDQETLLVRLAERFDANIKRGDLEEAAKDLAALEQSVSDPLQLADKRRTYSLARQERDVQERLQHLRMELDQLWAIGSITKARDARYKAEVAAREFPQVAEFHELLEDARRRESEAAATEQVWVTALQLENFQVILDDLEKRAKVATVLPTFKFDEQIADGRLLLSVARLDDVEKKQALDQLRQQIRGFSSRKASEMRRLAEQDLPANPHEAESRLRQALNFTFLPNADSKAIRDYLQQEIAPRVRRRDEVNRVARQALESAEPLRAWKELRDARLRDPAAQEVLRTLDILRPQVLPSLTQQLARCQEILEAGRWEEAEREAGSLRDLLHDDETMADLHEKASRLVAKAVALQAMRREVDATKDEMNREVQGNLAQAQQLLTRVETDAGELARYFPEIAAWRDLVDARSDLRKTLTNIEVGYRSLGREELEQRLARLRDLRSQMGDLLEIEITRQKLDIRRDFLIGESTFQQPVFRDQAEPLLHRVVNSGSEDAAAARRLLEELGQQRANKASAEKALDDAKYSVEKQKDYLAALGLLAPWEELPGDVGQRIRRDVRSYKEAWQIRILAQLNVIKDKPSLKPIAETEALVSQLKKLAPIEGREWELEYMPDVYEHAAKTASSVGISALDTALQYWQKGVDLNPMRQSLVQGKRTAVRAITARDAQALRARVQDNPDQALADAESKWLQYTRQYQDDVEAYIELARLAMERQRHQQALRYLESAALYDEADDAAFRPSIAALRKDASEALDIQSTEAMIERELSVSNQAYQYESAKTNFVELVKRYPKREAQLDSWFAAKKRELVQLLVTQMQQLAEDADERWPLAVKILVLDPNNPEAHRQVDQSVRALNELQERTEQLIEDLIGPKDSRNPAGDTVEIPAGEALAVQISNAKALQRRAYDLRSLFDEQARHLSDNTDQKAARECIEKINRRIKELGELERLVSRGRVQLRSAAGRALTTDEFAQTIDPFDSVTNTLGEISQLPLAFNNHRSVAALQDELAATRKQIQAISADVAALQKATDDEKFDTILSLIEKLIKLDPRDLFDVKRRVRIRDKFRGDEVPLVEPVGAHGFDSLKTRTLARLDQWRRVDQWQCPMDLAGWLSDRPVPASSKRLSWAQHCASACQAAWKSGDFDKARQLIEQALGDNASTAPDFEGRWSLRHCRAYMSEPRSDSGDYLEDVVDTMKALSGRVQAVTLARVNALAMAERDIQLIEGPTNDGKPGLLARIRQERNDFISYVDTVDGILGQLQDKGFLGRSKVSRQERSELCVQMWDLLKNARAIAPEYPGWKTILPQANDECPGGS